MLYKIIKKLLKESYIDKYGNFIDSDLHITDLDINSFPESVKDTLKNEYLINISDDFVWNDKMDEIIKGKLTHDEFNQFLKDNENLKLINNLDKLIKWLTQDMILLKKRKIAKLKLEAFEKLIIPTLGNKVLNKKLSLFHEIILLDSNASIESISKGFKEAENIIDADGSINKLKTTPSDMFTGESINIPAFEKYIEQNPEFKGVYDDWKKIFDYEMELELIDLHSFRSSTPITKMRELRNFLIELRKKINKK